MIYGIGIDLIEIERIEKVLHKQSKIIERVLTPDEKLNLRILLMRSVK